MADKRRAGPPEKPDKQVPEKSPSRREPGLLARIVAQQFWTAIIVAVLICLLAGWAIYQKIRLELDVPAPLIAYVAVGLAIAAVGVVLRILLHGDVHEVLRRETTDKDGRHLLKEARRSLKDHAVRLSPVQKEELERAAGELETALGTTDWDAIAQAASALDKRLDQYLESHRASTAREYVESILVAVGIAFFLRAFVVEAFKIPSGSMIPTLQVGDHIFVNKFIYGLRIPWTNIKLGMNIRKPQRGEVVVFKFPRDEEKDFIKRIVAVEGDTVEIRDNVLYVNGQATPREHMKGEPCEYEDFDELKQQWEHRRCDAWKETLNGHSYTTIFDRGSPPRSWSPAQQFGWPSGKVPPATVFVMGDNRDNSHDSRYWGTVNYELLRGKAMIIWWSLGEPEGIRVGRIGQVID